MTERLKTGAKRRMKGCSATGFQVDRADELITATHDASDGLVALAFPSLDRVSLVPGFVKLTVLLGQAQIISFAHVKVGARNHAANRRSGHDLFGFEVDLRQARAILARLCRQPAKTEIVAITINLANAGDQVMKVRFRNFVNRVIAGAVFSATVLPALTLMANLPGRNDMFPLDACCPVGIFTRDIATGFKVDPVACVFAATIKLGGLRCVEFPGRFFGFAECFWGCGLST